MHTADTDTRRAETLTERLDRVRRGDAQVERFVAPWRRRQLAQAERQPGGRFVAVTDLTPAR